LGALVLKVNRRAERGTPPVRLAMSNAATQGLGDMSSKVAFSLPTFTSVT
jgi:hypothetical protein